MRAGGFVLLLFATHGHASECFLPPSSPDDCSLIDAARAVLETARTALGEGYKESSGKFAEKDAACFMSSVNYLTHCCTRAGFKSTDCECGHFRVSGTRELGLGWTEEGDALIAGKPGECRFDLAKSPLITSIQAPEGSVVLQGLLSGDTPPIRMYKITKGVACALVPSKQSERSFTISPKGVLVVDWTDAGKVSAHWGKRAEPLGPGGDPKLTPLDGDTLRYEWPNGATVDLTKDGLKGSNFLDDALWDPARCQTETYKDKRHYFPRLELKPGQKFMKEAAGFIKA